MKKYLICILTAITAIFAMTTLSAYAIDPKYETVKVGLSYSSTAKSSLTVVSNDGYGAGRMEGSNFQGSFALAEATLRISAKNDNTITINGLDYNVNGNFALSPLNGMVNIDGRIYKGGVELIPRNGKLTVINFVNINDYVAAVVGKEMSPTWNIEALKAQAVCARSYTLCVWNKHSSLGFNLCSTQDCQTYLGIEGETESTIRASKETENQLLMYNGTVAQTLYASSHGGSSAYAKNVWGGDVPYLVAVQDDFENPDENPRAHWTKELSREDIKARLAKSSIDIGDIVDMKVTGADEYGRTFEVTIYGTKGNYVLKNDNTRAFFNLYSQKYTITPPGGVAPKVFVQTSSGKSEISFDRISGGSDKVFAKGSTGVSEYSKTTGPGDKYIINGSGWGHGVGMSQYGAKGMADRGYGYKDILYHYFPGTEIQ